MNKSKYILGPVLICGAIGLAGCGVNQNETADNNRLEATKPIGYYSNEQHETNHAGDNDGPMTEMMDHTLGNENTNKINTRNVNYRSDTAKDNQNQNENQDQNSVDSEMAQKAVSIAKDNKDVQDAQSIVYGNKVILALEVTNKENIDKTKKDVQNSLADTFKNKDISVITDRGIFTDIEDINKSIKNGQPQRTITNSLEKMEQQIDSLR